MSVTTKEGEPLTANEVYPALSGNETALERGSDEARRWRAMTPPAAGRRQAPDRKPLLSTQPYRVVLACTVRG